MSEDTERMKRQIAELQQERFEQREDSRKLNGLLGELHYLLCEHHEFPPDDPEAWRRLLKMRLRELIAERDRFEAAAHAVWVGNRYLAMLDGYTDEQRREVFSALSERFCRECGRDHGGENRACQCWNDE